MFGKLYADDLQSHLMPGVYYLEATTDQKSVCSTKLVIVR